MAVSCAEKIKCKSSRFISDSFSRFPSGLVAFSFWFPLVLCPAGLPCSVLVIYSYGWCNPPAKCRVCGARSRACNISDNFLLPAKFIESILTLICQNPQHCSDSCFNFIWSFLAARLLGWLIMLSLPQSAWEKVQKSVLAKHLDCNETSSWPTKLFCQRQIPF